MKLASFIKNSLKNNLLTICCFVSIANGEQQFQKGSSLENLSSQTKKEQNFSIENMFSKFLQSTEITVSNDKNKASKPKDYFEENTQAFAEDDPWE